MPAYKRTFLKEGEKKKYSRRLTHYLEDYTYRNKITHNEAAKKLGISSNKFSQLKSGGEQGRFLSSLDYLKSIAVLDDLSLPEFIKYIEGEDNNPDTVRQRLSWEEKLY